MLTQEIPVGGSCVSTNILNFNALGYHDDRKVLDKERIVIVSAHPGVKEEFLKLTHVAKCKRRF
jgi:hypothetical protein